MALKQRLVQLERVSRRSTQDETVIVMACSCGGTDRELPPDFNGHVIRIIRSVEDCSHKATNPPKPTQGTWAPNPAAHLDFRAASLQAIQPTIPESKGKHSEK